MGEPGWDCIMERQRTPGTFDFVEVWHVARTRGRSHDFVPIRCSPDEGVVFPGHVERRQPTCPDCVSIVAPSTDVPQEEKEDD